MTSHINSTIWHAHEMIFAYTMAIIVDFLLFAFVAIIYSIVKTKQWQYIGVITQLLLMTIAHGLFYLGLLGIVGQGVTWGLYLGFYLVLSLIFMMIRRLFPFFIERGLGLEHELKNSKFIDVSSLILLAIFIPIEIFFNTPIGAALALALLLIHSIRVSD